VVNEVRLASILLAVICLVLAGCDGLPIGLTNAGDVQRTPAAYEGKDLRLRGTVAQATKIPLIDIKTYVLKDATGELMVVTSGQLPTAGEEVMVMGRAENLAILGGQGLGLTVKEGKRLSVGVAGIGWSSADK
jgi:hypothetical protein